MDWTFEVVVVPVDDVDRAIAFYRDQLGFNLDFDTRLPQERFAQLTPPGSGCSIQVKEPSPMAPGSLKGLQLVVADAYRAREELVARGVAAGDIDVIDERDGGTLFEFTDPDGNSWVVQQIKDRADRPLIPRLPQ
jgi:catechol 2,3-dioxygenase-like lactoylglutathione lyase family enzyme